jgi:chromosome segregation ATPase
VESDERVVKGRERFSRAEARKKMFDKLSVDMDKQLKKERKGPRRMLSKVEREIHHVERDWKTSQRKLEDLKMQSRLHRADIAKAQEEFSHLIHRDVDLEKPVELDTAKVESAKKKLERRVKRATRAIARLEKKIPKLIQEELVQRGRLEQVRIERESIKSGFRDLPIEEDPRMTSFLEKKRRIAKDYDDSKVELDDVIVKVRKERKKQRRKTDRKTTRKKDTKEKPSSRSRKKGAS